MGLIRDLPEHLRVDLERAFGAPLRRVQEYTIDAMGVPADFGVTSTKNTAVCITFDRWSGLALYNRKVISAHFAATLAVPTYQMALGVASAKRTVDLLPDVNRFLGTEFKEEEILDEPLELTFETTSVTIKMAPENLWFTGELVIPLKGKYQQIDEVLVYDNAFKVDPWTKFLNPTRDGLFDGWMATHNKSYTTVSEILRGIPSTVTQNKWTNLTIQHATTLANALKSVDGLPWTAASINPTTYDYNLFNACVVYNGPVEGFDPQFDLLYLEVPSDYWLRHNPARKDHSHVLVLQPNPNYGAKNLRYSPIYIHYGELVDPTFWSQPDRLPVHRWKLEKDLLNTGSSVEKPAFPDIVSFFTSEEMQKRMTHFNADGEGIAQLKATVNAPLGVTMDINNDCTISFNCARQDLLAAAIGLFSDSTGLDVNGGIKYTSDGVFYPQGFTARWVNGFDQRAWYWHRVKVTFVYRKKVVYVYLNERLVGEYTTTAPYLTPLTNFGRCNQFLAITTLFGDIKFYDYALNLNQVMKLNRGLL